MYCVISALFECGNYSKVTYQFHQPPQDLRPYTDLIPGHHLYAVNIDHSKRIHIGKRIKAARCTCNNKNLPRNIELTDWFVANTFSFPVRCAIFTVSRIGALEATLEGN